MALDASFKTLALLAICSTQKSSVEGFLLKNCKIDASILQFVEILKTLGLEIKIDGTEISLKSQGILTFFEPEKELDIQGNEAILYALVGLFSNLDYNIFFVSSEALNLNFSSLILGLYDSGIRFNYSKNFSLPIQMKGTSNFLPMVHTLMTENHFLALTFLLAGMSGIGRTQIILPQKNVFFEKVLKDVKANFRIAENAISVALNDVEKEEKIELDLKNYD